MPGNHRLQVGKITVKHFLNVNLKPYLVRGEKFFPVYLLIIVHQKTTKVRSHEFAELQTEEDFEKIINSKNAKVEIETVENLIDAQISCFREGIFDTNLFSALYNLMPRYSISRSVTFKAALKSTGKINDADLDYLVTYTGLFQRENNTIVEPELTFYEWFDPSMQKNNSKYLKKFHIPAYSIRVINQVVVISFFEVLMIIAHSQRKYHEMKAKYAKSFDSYFHDAQKIASKLVD